MQEPRSHEELEGDEPAAGNQNHLRSTSGSVNASVEFRSRNAFGPAASCERATILSGKCSQKFTHRPNGLCKQPIGLQWSQAPRDSMSVSPLPRYRSPKNLPPQQYQLSSSPEDGAGSASSESLQARARVFRKPCDSSTRTGEVLSINRCRSALQKRLIQHGYFSGEVRQNFGSARLSDQQRNPRPTTPLVY